MKTKKMLIVGESVSYSEKKTGKLLNDRFGDFLKRLLEMAKVPNDAWLYEIIQDKLKLWNLIKLEQPVVIIALGKKVTSILTKTPEYKIQLDECVGKEFVTFGIPVVPLWSVRWLFRNTKEKSNETIQILFDLKERFLKDD